MVASAQSHKDSRNPVRQIECVHGLEDGFAHTKGGLARRGGQGDAQLGIGMEQGGEHDHDGTRLAGARTTREQEEILSHGGSHGQGLVFVDMRGKGLAKKIESCRIRIDGWAGHPQGESPGDLVLVFEMPPEVKTVGRSHDEGKIGFLVANCGKGFRIGGDRGNLCGREMTGALPRLLGKLPGQLTQNLCIRGRFPPFEKGGDRTA